ncbi:hypothetical protein TWF730_010012 [Orbilia blumenaviensis]|uniref:Uncharacterized protein n=1 Tax=Orbilia blumenaviensis TaxID=1796055 RepID=A0AAV9UUW0_9PEZI
MESVLVAVKDRERLEKRVTGSNLSRDYVALGRREAQAVLQSGSQDLWLDGWWQSLSDAFEIREAKTETEAEEYQCDDTDS